MIGEVSNESLEALFVAEDPFEVLPEAFLVRTATRLIPSPAFFGAAKLVSLSPTHFMSRRFSAAQDGATLSLFPPPTRSRCSSSTVVPQWPALGPGEVPPNRNVTHRPVSTSSAKASSKHLCDAPVPPSTNRDGVGFFALLDLPVDS